MDFSADFPTLYSDFGVDVLLRPAVGGELSGRAMLDQPSVQLLGGEYLATDYGLRYPAATFPGARRGDQFVVGGVTYIAREHPLAVGPDGLEVFVPLSKT